MKCPKCGSEIEKDASFCVQCGTRVLEPNKSLSRNKGVIAAIIIGVLAVVIAIAALVVALDGQNDNDVKIAEQQNQAIPSRSEDSTEDPSKNSATPSAQETTDSSKAATKNTEDRVNEKWGYLVMDQSLKDVIKAKKEDGDINLYSVKGDAWVAKIRRGYQQYEDETKKISCQIGEFVHDGKTEPVFLILYMLNNDGQHMYAGYEGGELGLESICHISPAELCKCIFIKSGDNYKKAVLSKGAQKQIAEVLAQSSNASSSETMSSSSDSVTIKTSHRPFWGLWVGGSESRSEMVKVLKKAKSLGFKNAAIYVTTDWANLNPKKMYVVSVGRYQSKVAANKDLSKAKQIDSEAYPKRTGEYIGS